MPWKVKLKSLYETRNMWYNRAQWGDTMKNKKIVYWLLIIFSILGIILCISNLNQKEEAPVLEPIKIESQTKKEKNGININKIKSDYQNNDIIGYIIIPNVVSYD